MLRALPARQSSAIDSAALDLESAAVDDGAPPPGVREIVQDVEEQE